MISDELLTRIGATFGDDIVALVRTNRAFTVTIVEVTDDVAYVTMTGGKEKIPVPLTCISIANGSFKVKPTVDSLAIVQFADSAENAPFFVAFSEVDEYGLTIGESTLTVTDGLWEFNGGELGGITKAQELKTQLDKLSARVDGIINAIENGVPAPTDGGLAYQTTMKVILATLIDVEDFSNIENEKITQ